MKEQRADVGRGGANPRMSGEAEPALGGRARRSLPSDVGRGGVCPQTLGEAEPALGGRARRSQPSRVEGGGANLWGSDETELTLGPWARGVVALLSVRKHQRLMIEYGSHLWR